MVDEVVARVRAEIDEHLATLQGAVEETRQLEGALVALDDVMRTSTPEGQPRPAPGQGAQRQRKRRANRRKRGSSEPLVLAAFTESAGPLDIRTVSEHTGISPSTTAYTLKKLAATGVLVQSQRTGAPGLPKLSFALATPSSASTTQRRTTRTGGHGRSSAVNRCMS